MVWDKINNLSIVGFRYTLTISLRVSVFMDNDAFIELAVILFNPIVYVKLWLRVLLSISIVGATLVQTPFSSNTSITKSDSGISFRSLSS
jgi:hypothetical protein